jgi:hypothetical protein
MSFTVSQPIRDAVFEVIRRAEANGRYVNVYEAAQQIQDGHPRENIALEDIVATLVDCAAGKSLVLELSYPRTEGFIPVDFYVREPV